MLNSVSTCILWFLFNWNLTIITKATKNASSFVVFETRADSTTFGNPMLWASLILCMRYLIYCGRWFTLLLGRILWHVWRERLFGWICRRHRYAQWYTSELVLYYPLSRIDVSRNLKVFRMPLQNGRLTKMGVCVDTNDCFKVENLISRRTQSIHLPAIPSLSGSRSMITIFIKNQLHCRYPQLQASATSRLSQIFRSTLCLSRWIRECA